MPDRENLVCAARADAHEHHLMTHSHQLRARIIRHARSGDLDRAEALLAEYAQQLPTDDHGHALLRGRVLKERAKRAEGSKAAQLFDAASQAYEAAAGGEHFSYPLINAATLALLAGKTGRALALARRTLQALDDNPGEAETPYWRHATRAEAHLVCGALAEARAALAEAMAVAPDAWEDHALTLEQFALLCRELDHSCEWLEIYRPPGALQFAGIMNVAPDDGALKTQIAAIIATRNIGFGFGALAAGSDILVAEALIEHGAQLHVVLPCPQEVFRHRSVAAIDPHWVARFDRLIEAAASVEVLETSLAPDSPSVALANDVARGLAVERARFLRTEQVLLRIVGLEDAIAAPPEEGDDAVVLRAPRADCGGYDVATDSRLVLVAASRDHEGSVTTHEFGDYAAIVDDALTRLARGHTIAIDHLFRSKDTDDDDGSTQRVEAMLAVGERTELLAGKPLALALLATGAVKTIHPCGEVRSARGPVAVYRLTP